MEEPIPPKKTKGVRRKIELKPLEDPKLRSVTFTKRKAGLFKKADELCTRTGAEVALMVMSPGGKPFTFGSPDVDSVITRYKSQVPTSFRIEQRQAERNEIMKQLAYEDKRAEELKKRRRQMMNETWMAAPTQTFSRAKKQEMTERLVELHKKLSQPPALNSHGIFPGPPPPSSSFTALLTQNPQLEASSGLSSGSFLAPMTTNQYFGSNMVLTPSGNFYTGVSSSSTVVPPCTGNNMFGGESSSMVQAGTLNNMFGQYSHGNFYTVESSSMVPAGTKNLMFEDNMNILNNNDNFYPAGESSSMVPTRTQKHLSEDDMILNNNDNFTRGSSSKMPAETQKHMLEDIYNMLMNDDDDNLYTCGSSSMAAGAQRTMSNDSMRLEAIENFFRSGALTEEPTPNQMIDENIMNIPPHDNNNFYTSGGSSVAAPPPADKNHQTFDQNFMVPLHVNHYACESSAMMPTTDDENFDENLRLFLDYQFFESSYSMMPPAQSNQMFGGEMAPPQQPPPCHGYGAGHSWFN